MYPRRRDIPAATDPDEGPQYRFSRIYLASFGDRGYAILIDGILVALLYGCCVELLELAKAGTTWGYLLYIQIGWSYCALQESGKAQATVGKRATGIRVMDTSWKAVDFNQASVRYFSKLLSGLILCLGFFMALGDDQCRALHDRLARTLVVWK